MVILGISAFHQDSAACLLRNGRVVAAAPEERFTRVRHDDGFPTQAIAYCLQEANLDIEAVDHVVLSENPANQFHRVITYYLCLAPQGLQAFLSQMPVWIQECPLTQRALRRRLHFDGELTFHTYGESLTAAAFFPSPFEEAVCIVSGGCGQDAVSAYGHGQGNQVTVHRAIGFPHSLSILYSACAAFTGFTNATNDDALMRLASFGEPRYEDTIRRELIDIKQDGSYRLNIDYFDLSSTVPQWNERFAALVEGDRRTPDTPITQREADLARSVQEVIEDVFLRMVCFVHRETGTHRLALAGDGVQNLQVTGRLQRESPFKELWIQPATGNTSAALGSALYAWHHTFDVPRAKPACLRQSAYLGPAFSDDVIDSYLAEHRIPHDQLDEKGLCDRTAALLTRGMIIGWFQGRMEFGSHGLGGRSILGDPRSQVVQSKLNKRIIGCESSRPHMVSVMAEHMNSLFALDYPSPYGMLQAPLVTMQALDTPTRRSTIAEFDRLPAFRASIPAGVDQYSLGRVHTVNTEDNPLFHRLLAAFHRYTGCPALISTSLCYRHEPIACTPAEAYACFMRTGMDYLVMGSYILAKVDQEPWEESDA